MIYLSYICTRNSAKGELSSVGSERLPYKQRVGGSNPSTPTPLKEMRHAMHLFFYAVLTQSPHYRTNIPELRLFFHLATLTYLSHKSA